nr:hypothetical protein BN993_03660 [Virgibacillus halodenitrificans]
MVGLHVPFHLNGVAILERIECLPIAFRTRCLC